MGIKNIFQGMSSWVQLLFLCLFAFIGLILISLLSAVFTIPYILQEGGDPFSSTQALMQSPDFIRLTSFFQQILVFLLPALVCAYLFSNNVKRYFKIDKPLNLNFTIAAVVLVFVVQPIVGFANYYNQKLRLPDSMAGLENWMRNLEDTNMKLMEIMLSGDTLSVLLVNLVIIAVMAGIVEEFFFRGAMQQIFRKITCNNHLAVWITAFLFSAVHFQFYGFLPRLLLGALLGYLFVWSGNLWIPVIIHFINNAMSVLIFRFYHGSVQYQQMENLGTQDTWWVTLLSVILAGGIISYMVKYYNQRKFNKTVF